MIRWTDLCLVGFAFAAALLVYDLKYEAEEKAKHKAGLIQSLEEERATIDLLEAEWSVLNQPARLQTLAEQYGTVLSLEALSIDQVSHVNNVPLRPVDVAPIGSDRLGGYAGLHTGAIQ